MPDEADITRILERLSRGEDGAAAELLGRVYAELHRLACAHMRGQRPQHTLQPTALVHEAYLRLLDGGEPCFRDRDHFMRVASRAMRCVLVDHARGKARLKRSPRGERLPLDDLAEAFEERAEGLVALDAALERLATLDARAVEVVELRFFGGQTLSEIARILGVSERTVERDWSVARAWLRKELS